MPATTTAPPVRPDLETARGTDAPRASAGSRPKRAAVVALGVLVTAGCLAFAAWGVDWGAVRAAFASANYFTLPGVLALLAAFFWLKAVRWAWLLEPLAESGKTFTAGGVLGPTMVGFAGNNLLPAHLGEVLRVFVLCRRRAGEPAVTKAAVFSTVVLERLFDVGAILTLFAAGLLATPAAGAMRNAALVAAAVLAAAVAVFGVYVAKTDWFVRTADAALARAPLVPASLRTAVVRLLTGGAAGLAALRSGTAVAKVAAVSLVHWALMAAMIDLCLRAFGVDLSVAAGAVVNGVIAFGVTVPSTPGFFGVVQACFIAATAPLGVPKETALAASVYYQLTQWVPITAIGLAFLAKEGLGLRSATRAAGDDGTG